jgi:iron(III) transport system substrate-binding protein
VNKLFFKGLAIIFFLLGVIFLANAAGNEVVIYTSQDQMFSEPILKEFEEQTGIKVKAVYDVEAAKTVGLINRLIAEKDNPQADVFWNSEVCRTIVLKKKDVLTPYISPQAADIPINLKDKDNYWTGFGGRARIIVYNTSLVDENNVPKSILDLTASRWKGKTCMANPLFGTGATHAAALYVLIGKEKFIALMAGLKANNVLIVDGNAPARDRVITGLVPAGYTDTDDAAVSINEGKPIAIIFPDEYGKGTLVMPNSVALIKNSPHQQNGKKLIDFLLSKEVESKLLFSGAMQIPSRRDIAKPQNCPAPGSFTPMEIDFQQVAEAIEDSGTIVKETLLK